MLPIIVESGACVALLRRPGWAAAPFRVSVGPGPVISRSREGGPFAFTLTTKYRQDLAIADFNLPSSYNKRVRWAVEALLYEVESCPNRAGALIGMAACAMSGGVVGFVLGLAVGIWL
jgi:hypothetical protein